MPLGSTLVEQRGAVCGCMVLLAASSLLPTCLSLLPVRSKMELLQMLWRVGVGSGAGDGEVMQGAAIIASSPRTETWLGLPLLSTGLAPSLDGGVDWAHREPGA